MLPSADQVRLVPVERFLRAQMFQVVGAELRGQRCRRLQTDPEGPVQPSHRSRSQAGCPIEQDGGNQSS